MLWRLTVNKTTEKNKQKITTSTKKALRTKNYHLINKKSHQNKISQQLPRPFFIGTRLVSTEF